MAPSVGRQDADRDRLERASHRRRRRPGGVSAAEWNTLGAAPYPFLRHEFLRGAGDRGLSGRALGGSHSTCSPTRGNGWSARALYLKLNSYGEFVFDWAWADAYRRNGPRLLPEARRRPRPIHPRPAPCSWWRPAGAECRARPLALMQRASRRSGAGSRPCIGCSAHGRGGLLEDHGSPAPPRLPVPLAQCGLQRLRRFSRRLHGGEAQKGQAGAPPGGGGGHPTSPGSRRPDATEGDWASSTGSTRHLSPARRHPTLSWTSS